MPVITNQFWITQGTNPTTQVWNGSTGAYVANNAAAVLTWLNANDGRADQNVGPLVATGNNGAGKLRVTCGDASKVQTGMVFNVVGNVNGAFGAAAVTAVNATQFDVPSIAAPASPDTGGTIWTPTIIDTFADLMGTIDSYNRTLTPPQSITVTSGVNQSIVNTPPLLFIFNPTTGGLALTLPQMNVPGSIAIGDPLVIFNISSFSFTVFGFNGVAVTVVNPLQLLYVFLVANSTQSGILKDYLIFAPYDVSPGNSNQTLVAGNSLIDVFSTTAVALGGPITWTLPAANSKPAGSFVLITDTSGVVTSSNTLSVAPAGSDNINKSASAIALNRAHDFLLLVTNGGTLWDIVGGHGALASTDLADLPIPVSSGGTGAAKYNACRMYLNVSQTGITNNTLTKINIDTVDFDADSIADTTNHRIKPNVAGTFLVTASVFLFCTGATTAMGPGGPAISKNGANIRTASINLSTANAQFGNLTMTTLIQMNGSTDFIELQGVVTNTGGTNWQALAGIANTYLECVRVGP